MDTVPPASPQSHEHHTVPRFWLRQFADANGFLKQIEADKDEFVVRRIHRRKATVVNDLYVLDTGQQIYDTDERKLLGPIEAKGSKALSALRKAADLSTVWPLADEARSHIAMFLAASVLRTPKHRQIVEFEIERYLERADRPFGAIDLFRSGRIVGEPESMDRLGRRYGLWREGENVPSNVHSDYLRTELPNLARHLFHQRWALMRTPVATFIIPDNPVALTGILATGMPDFYNANFLDSRMSFAALTRNLVLVTDWHPSAVLAKAQLNGDMILPFDQQLAQITRALLIANAHTHLFEHPDDTIIEDFWALGDDLRLKSRKAT